jgi:transcriptional regulator with GAF, ATPase, and Fis domain
VRRNFVVSRKIVAVVTKIRYSGVMPNNNDPTRAAGLLLDPKALLLELAGHHLLSELLPLAVNRLAAHPNVALARIWLKLPTPPEDCAKCRFASECPQRDHCLHLVASSGASLQKGEVNWSRLDGNFRRFPLGIRKVGRIATSGQSLEVSDVGSDQSWVADPVWIKQERIESFAGHPLIHRGEVLGVLGLFARAKPGPTCFEWFRMIADHLAASIANARMVDEIASLKSRLEIENEYLREEVEVNSAFGDLIGASPAINLITRQIELVASTDSTVLILGESGTGKEVVAREIHRCSRRANRPLIKVNCAAIPRELYESEFFGHSKGSFTGALRDRIGRFELADGGTLFLDEIGEIPLDMQAKLLRVLQEGELERIGEEKTRKVNVRIIAATNRDLRAEAEANRFRQDLYYRLSVFPLELPPLRKRLEDIPLLAEHFLSRFARQLGQPKFKLTLASIQDLQRYSWPGNVRELQHVLERACIVSERGRLQFDHLRDTHSVPKIATSQPGEKILTNAELREMEASNLRAALKKSNGKIYGDDGAAAILGMKPTTLISRIKTMSLDD